MSASSVDVSRLPGTPTVRRIALPIAVSAAGLFTVAYLGYLLLEGHLPVFGVSTFRLINFTFTMQLGGLVVSLAALLVLYLYDRVAFRTFFRFRLRTPDDTASTWPVLGPVLLVAFSMGLIAMMSFTVAAGKGTMNGTFFSLLPLVLVFAATNAWTEEILSRCVIVAGLSGKLPPSAICWISGVLFGVAHVRGTPSGVFGVITTGILGGLLAKSVVDTRSLGWALLIHFFLDVIIFGAGAMVLAGSVE